MGEQVGTDIELVIILWLTKRGIDFQFQSSLMGGFYELGGAVVDFIVQGYLAWRVFGEYWHRGVRKEGSDAVQREMLENLDFTVVDIWSDDIESRLDETLTKALQGEEMLH